MSIELRREYVCRVKKRYQISTKRQKTKILDEFCETSGYSRKYAIKIMNDTVDPFKKPRKGRPAYYNAAVAWHLKELWELLGRCGSRTLVGSLPLWMPFYGAGSGLTDEVAKRLLEMSAATADRILKPHRARVLKGRSTTRTNYRLRNQVPIKQLGYRPSEPGYLEIDLVAHCSTPAIGKFANTLTATDLATGWTENRVLLGKTEEEVVRVLGEIEKDLPFKLRGISCDNGTEFLNYRMMKFLRERPEPIKYVRTRSYRKNDNAHVEQKNWSHVRQLFGYERIDHPLLVPLMNTIYRENWNPLKNFFFTCRKLQTKTREGAKLKKVYDQPQTPYQRVLASDAVTEEQKEKLRERFRAIHPIEKTRKLNQMMKRFDQHLNKLNQRWDAA